MADSVLTRLETLLAEERTALLDADYGQLASLAPEKARLVTQLSEASEDPQMLARAGAGLRRNQAILAAALSGLRDATGRGEARRAVAAVVLDLRSQRRAVDGPRAGQRAAEKGVSC